MLHNEVPREELEDLFRLRNAIDEGLRLQPIMLCMREGQAMRLRAGV